MECGFKSHLPHHAVADFASFATAFFYEASP